MPPAPEATGPVELFYSYAHEDEPFREAIEAHLGALRRDGLLTFWHDRMIEPGTSWSAPIDAHINSAGVILLLVSADFLNSTYCFDVEMKRALERYEAGEARVIPIILRPCDWEHTPIRQLQALPRDAKPITTWPDRDEALRDVVRGIRRVVKGQPLGPDDAGPRPRPWRPSKALALWTGGGCAAALMAGLALTNLPARKPDRAAADPATVAGDDAGDTPGVTGTQELPPPTSAAETAAQASLPSLPVHDKPECARLAGEYFAAMNKPEELPAKSALVRVENRSGQPLTVLRYVHTCKRALPNDPEVRTPTFQDLPVKLALAAGETRDYAGMEPGLFFFQVKPDTPKGDARPINVFTDWHKLEPGGTYRIRIDRLVAKGGRDEAVEAHFEKTE